MFVSARCFQIRFISLSVFVLTNRHSNFINMYIDIIYCLSIRSDHKSLLCLIFHSNVFIELDNIYNPRSAFSESVLCTRVYFTTLEMLVPIYLVVTFINILANSQNFNINPNSNPDMDIRVRRGVYSQPYPAENTGHNTENNGNTDPELYPVGVKVENVQTNSKIFLKRLKHDKNSNRIKRNYKYTLPQQNNSLNNSYLPNNTGYFNNNNPDIHGYLQNNNSTVHPVARIKYNNGYYYLYPNASYNNVSPYNFTNYNNKLGLYPYFNPNNTTNINTNQLYGNSYQNFAVNNINNQSYQNNPNTNHNNALYNSYDVNTSSGLTNQFNNLNHQNNPLYNSNIINTNQLNNNNFSQNNLNTNDNNQLYNGNNLTSRYNISVNLKTTTPKIEISCIMGCRMGCPAFFKKIGIYCIPEDDIDE